VCKITNDVALEGLVAVATAGTGDGAAIGVATGDVDTFATGLGGGAARGEVSTPPCVASGKAVPQPTTTNPIANTQTNRTTQRILNDPPPDPLCRNYGPSPAHPVSCPVRRLRSHNTNTVTPNSKAPNNAAPAT
jgi:hypothetical protein